MKAAYETEVRKYMRLDERVALITGGTQGVGAAIAESLAKAGCDLILHGLEQNEHCEQTVRRCEEAGARVEVLFADLSQVDTGSLADFLTRVDSASQSIDGTVTLLVNNAGTYSEPGFLDVDLATFEKTMHLNVFAGYFLTQAFAKRWIAEQTAGRVLFTGSINGILSEPDHTVYDTSKGAVHAMVRSLCVALAPHRIRVNAMAPGLVVTPLTGQVLDTDAAVRNWMKLHTPNGQVPGPESCGAAALFLLSDEAEHVQGQTLLVDGGMSIWQQPDLPASLHQELGTDHGPS